jgi:enolase
LEFNNNATKKQALSSEETGRVVANECPTVAFDPDDRKYYSGFMKVIGNKLQILADDLLCTSTRRIATALDN